MTYDAVDAMIPIPCWPLSPSSRFIIQFSAATANHRSQKRRCISNKKATQKQQPLDHKQHAFLTHFFHVRSEIDLSLLFPTTSLLFFGGGRLCTLSTLHGKTSPRACCARSIYFSMCGFYNIFIPGFQILLRCRYHRRERKGKGLCFFIISVQGDGVVSSIFLTHTSPFWVAYGGVKSIDGGILLLSYLGNIQAFIFSLWIYLSSNSLSYACHWVHIVMWFKAVLVLGTATVCNIWSVLLLHVMGRSEGRTAPFFPLGKKTKIGPYFFLSHKKLGYLSLFPYGILLQFPAATL